MASWCGWDEGGGVGEVGGGGHDLVVDAEGLLEVGTAAFDFLGFVGVLEFAGVGGAFGFADEVE